MLAGRQQGIHAERDWKLERGSSTSGVPNVHPSTTEYLYSRLEYRNMKRVLIVPLPSPAVPAFYAQPRPDYVRL
jgi:hypothetical protein